MDVDVKIKLPTGKQIIDQLGLGEKGEAQMFHTANVLRRIQRYMPYRSGATIKLTIAQTDIRVPEIACGVYLQRVVPQREPAELHPHQEPHGRAILG